MKNSKRIFSIAVIGLVLVVFPLTSVLMSKLGFERGKDVRKELAEYKFGPLPDFTLTDQNGKDFLRRKLRGKVVVANFVNSDCTGNCATLMEQMALIQNEFVEEHDLLLLSLSTNPRKDSASVLNAFGDKFGADSTRWHLLTGDSAMLRQLITQDFHMDAGSNPALGPIDPYSNYFVLLDTAGRVRNFYKGTEPAEVLKLVEHVALLAPKDHRRKLETK